MKWLLKGKINLGNVLKIEYFNLNESMTHFLNGSAVYI